MNDCSRARTLAILAARGKSRAVVAAVLLVCAPINAQEGTVDLAGIWWQGAPVPLLPGESAAPGMGMGGAGMGVTGPSPPLNNHAQAMMADFDPADDPAVRCEQPGLVRQVLSPYPVQIEHRGDSVSIRYEEWEVERLVHLDAPPPEGFEPGPMGWSMGELDDERLVVNTTGFTPGLNMSRGFFWTSDEASLLETYSLTDRGQLVMDMELTDPVMLSEPWRLQKTWNPYDQELLTFDCILRERL